MNYDKWYKKMPSKFPEFINSPSEYTNGMKLQNPVIGGSQHQTMENIFSLLSLIKLLIRADCLTLSLSEKETRGLRLLLYCIELAASFEKIYRPDGGIPMEQKSTADDS